MPYIYKQNEDLDPLNPDCCPDFVPDGEDCGCVNKVSATPYPQVIPVGYIGTNTDTAKTIVDNRTHMISVDVNLKTVNKPYIHNQRIPSKVWTVKHNLEKIPAIITTLEDGQVVIGEVKYISLNDLKIEFSKQITGNAYVR